MKILFVFLVKHLRQVVGSRGRGNANAVVGSVPTRRNKIFNIFMSTL